MDRAILALRECEGKLRDLVVEAAQSGDYGEIERITAFAKYVNGLVESASQLEMPPARRVRPDEQSRDAILGRSEPAPARGKKTPKGYPKFEFEDDSLVKRGWSKKRREEYVQRAPRRQIEDIVDAIEILGSDKRPVRTEEILAAVNQGSEELPQYYVYLALGWLQESGLVKREGRRGYAVVDPIQFRAGFEKDWFGGTGDESPGARDERETT